jgi:hypothetical protein
MNTTTASSTVLTAAEVTAMNFRALRAAAPRYGVALRVDGKECSKGQLVEAMLALVAAAAPEPIAAAPEPIAEPIAAPTAAAPSTPSAAAVILEAIVGVEPVYPKRSGTKQATFLAALQNGATEVELKEIMGANKATLTRFFYYVCREVGKSFGVELVGETYRLIMPC